MPRAPRIAPTQVLVLPRPQAAPGSEWMVAAIALVLLLAGLLL